MNNIIETTGMIEFKNSFETHVLSDYECIYISFGSKCKCKNPSMTNANWRMIPGFIYDKKSLALCIDRFENKKNKNINKNILKQHIASNVNIIICDIDRTIQIFEIILLFIIQRLTTYSVNKENVIIVNYFRFTTPNHVEKYLEQNVSSCFQKVLMKTVYSNCFYEWFGYAPNLYNIIYRYNNRIIYNILPLVCKILKKELSMQNIQFLSQELHHSKIIELFLKNMYDITIKNTMKSLYEYV